MRHTTISQETHRRLPLEPRLRRGFQNFASTTNKRLAQAVRWPEGPSCTANPRGTWAAQQARQLAWSLSERLTPIRFLIHDRDSKFSKVFDEVFRSEGVEIIRTPFRAPKANAFAERWVGTVRCDCLDWILIVSRQQLEQVLRVYVDHYNNHRPHRALALKPPTPEQRLRLVSPASPDRVHRRDRLGGLIHEYAAAA